MIRFVGYVYLQFIRLASYATGEISEIFSG